MECEPGLSVTVAFCQTWMLLVWPGHVKQSDSDQPGSLGNSPESRMRVSKGTELPSIIEKPEGHLLLGLLGQPLGKLVMLW